jgi:hypothetical protein
MPAARSTSPQNNSTIIVLIIFIVLFLIAATLAVVLFMNNETVVKKQVLAQQKLDEIATSRDYAMLKGLLKGAAGNNVTAVGRLLADMRSMASSVAGEDMSTLEAADIRPTVDYKIAELWERLDQVPAAEGELDQSMGLVQIAEKLIDENSTWVSRYAQAEDARATEAQAAMRTIETLQTNVTELNTQLNVAASAAAIGETSYDQLTQELRDRFDKIIKVRDDEIVKAQAAEQYAQTQGRFLEKELESAKLKNKHYAERLAMFQPKPENEQAALTVDGKIVDVAVNDGVAYINLNNTNHLYRGLTFGVYDSFEEIPKTGRGKATIEVVEIMDTISKCRITRHAPANPIMTGDAIASLIWSKDELFTFCVIGSFDLDDDDIATESEKKRLIDMIGEWGGKVEPIVTVKTDFLVLGESPMVPIKPSPEEFDDNSTNAKTYTSALRKAQQYDLVKQEGTDMAVPTFPLNRFLYFIGQK